MYDDYDDNDDDYCQFASANSLSNENDDGVMDESRSNIIIDYDSPFEDNTNFDGDDSPFVDDSLNDVDHPLPSHEPYPTQYMQPHPNTYYNRMELVASSSSQMPPSFEASDLTPDVIAQLTPAQLAYNPEFMRLYESVQYVQNTLSAYIDYRLHREVTPRERILAWISGVHA